ncbi:hypothetical protein [Capnocytophaga granulosa]|uniref:hypothetical protein n=1 Tax=Capnocytophaga granulosa TaxID=45242 RepID=UPI0003A60F57|nr:hypothetical protein [Capnocytophaga granulosa]
MELVAPIKSQRLYLIVGTSCKLAPAGECKADTLKIGLSFFPAEPLIEDVREGDIPLDYVVTPEGVFEFCAEKK